MSEHTPTPWMSNYHEGIIFIPENALRDRVNICSVYPYQRQENIEFIVRAVNAHDELVAVLEEALDRIPAFIRGGGNEKFREKAIEVLAKAKGETP